MRFIKTLGAPIRLNMLHSFLVLSFLAGCTHERPTQFPDGEQEQVFEIQAIDQTQGTITLSSDLNSTQSYSFNSVQALGESGQYKVNKVNVVEAMKPLFLDFYVFGRPGQTLNVTFKIDSKTVTAYKVLTERDFRELPVLEQQISEKTTRVGKSALYSIPLFQVEIFELGVAERTRNDLNEKTRTLRIRPTEIKQATHIKISTLVRDRKDVGIPTAAQQDARQIFLKNRVNNSLLNQDEIREQLNVQLADKGNYLVQIGTDELHFLKVLKYSDLDETKQKAVDHVRAGTVPADRTFPCTKEQALAVNLNPDECVVDLAYTVQGIRYVQARRVPTDPFSLSSTVDFQTTTGKDQTRAAFIEIPRNPVPTSIRNGHDVRNQLVLKDLRGQEFLMRRTMQDSPNTFSETFAGSAGPLEIVKFEFDMDRVRVVRADPLLAGNGGSSVDKEILISLPAKYFKLSVFDTRGNRLSVPQMQATTHTDSDAIAEINWAENTIPTISSPLDFYQLERCFTGVNERQVEAVDQRLSTEGILNFTLTSTYSGNNNSFDCAGIMNAGYFDTVQKTFTFKERVSFKKHTKDPAIAESPELDLPYEAQKKLGFGLFTYTRKTPNERGLTHVDGTQVNMPSVFDIKNNRVITYVLKGLPKGKDAKSLAIRNAIEKATQQVIDDLNAGFKKALSNTSMDRSDDVLKLVIEEPEEDLGVLGDLDRNYIYYVEKPTKSGVIGLGGSHPNPRSGRVESASVYIYGGNILSMVDSLRRLDKASNDYWETREHLLTTEKSTPPLDNQKRSAFPPLDTNSLNAPGLNPFERKLNVHQGLNLVNGMRRLMKEQSLLSALPNETSPKSSELRAALPKLSRSHQVIFDTLSAAKELGPDASPDRLKQIYLAYQKAGGQPVDFRNLPTTPKQRMEKAGFCVHEANSDRLFDRLNKDYDIKNKDDIQVLVDVYSPTLAHELGHNLGLRHNFLGSYDSANFKFSPDEQSKRTYSSVMDYTVDDHIVYDGLAPYDIFALRAAYANALEMADGQLVTIQDYKKKLGLNSWLSLSENDVARAPLKKYLFCSDEEAGTRPTCNRFDWGSTPEDIVDFHIQSYRERYAISNFPADRLVFDRNGKSGYTGELFQRFMAIRQFLDETFYLLHTNQRQNIQSYVNASVKGSFFFNQVIRTPEASLTTSNADRFVVTEAPVQLPDGSVKGVPLVVERKWSEDIALDENSERLRLRGIEMDKVIATMMLTNRGFGFSRYEDKSLHFSYPDLEQYVFRTETKADLPSMSLLQDLLANNLQAAAPGLDELLPMDEEKIEAIRYANLSGAFVVTPTPLMRIFALLGAISDLDTQGLTSQDNLSSNFRILSSFQLPQPDMPFVQVQGGANDLKYYAFEESVTGRRLVEQSYGLTQLRLAEKELRPLLEKYLEIAAYLGNETPPSSTMPLQESTLEKGVKEALSANPLIPIEGAPDPTPQQAFEAITKMIDIKLATLPDSVGPKAMVELAPTLFRVLNVSAEIQNDVQGDLSKLNPLAIESFRNQLFNLSKSQPTIGLVLSTLLPREDGTSIIPPPLAEVASLLIDRNTLRIHEGYSFRNIEILSNVFMKLHPEYQR